MDLPIKHLTLLVGLSLAGACSSGSSLQAFPSADAAAAKPTGTGKKTPEAGPQKTDERGGEGESGSSEPLPPPYQISNRSLVQWKRHAAFEADLMRALKLSRDQLCVEVGGKNCIREVHLVPLGGNEPYESGLMKPSAEPLATTSSVVDRVLLSACSTRARLDSEGKPEVFTSINLKGPLPAAGDPAVAALVTDLYRRFLARDPEPHEVEVVAALANSEGDAPLSTQEFATLSCFTIGGTTEFLFF